MNRTKSRAIFALAVQAGVQGLVGQPAHAAPERVDEVAEYRIAKQQNLYVLAQTYFLRVDDYHVVQRLNHIRDPYHLQIGQMLRVPRRMLRAERLGARIAAFRGAIGLGSGRSVRVGLPLSEGERISTGANSFLSIECADGSIVSLPSQSRLVIARLRRTLLDNRIERSFTLEAGRSQSDVTHQPTNATFRVTTPTAVSAVRGTNFRNAVDASGSLSVTEVVDGVVDVRPLRSEANSLGVRAGYAAVSQSGAVGPLVKLQLAPTLAHPARPQSDRDLHFEVVPQRNASRYRAQVATDAGFVDTVSENDDVGPVITLPALPNGPYFVRLTALDAIGIEGLPRIYAFDRYLNALETSAISIPRHHRYVFRWRDIGQGTKRYRFVIAREGDKGFPVFDEPGLTRHEYTIMNLRPGTYTWRVMVTDIGASPHRSNWTATQTLVVTLTDRHRLRNPRASSLGH